MKSINKNLIVKELGRLVEKTSQTKTAKRVGVSTATMSQMLNFKWDHIDDRLWRKVMINLHIEDNWNIAETKNFKYLNSIMHNVQQMRLSIGIADRAGIGKTAAFRAYEGKIAEVVHVECKHYWSKKSFVKALMVNAGLDTNGTTEELIERFLDFMKGCYYPMIIIDQADKLRDSSLDLFMDFYNDLHGQCGFILSGVYNLKKRIMKGVQHDKMGYREIWSRIGSKFIDNIESVEFEDVKLICEANGVDEEDLIRYIYNICDNDLRKVRREVEKQQLRQNSQNKAA